MDACTKTSVCMETPKPSGSCIEVKKTLKKNQTPGYDALGPFPDEPLLASLDNVLYLMGAQNMQQTLNLPTLAAENCTCSNCSITIQRVPCSGATDSCTCTPTPKSCSNVFPKVPSAVFPILKKQSCSKCKVSIPMPVAPEMPCTSQSANIQGCACQHMKGLQSKIASAMASPRKMSLPLKRSFSLCSLACKKIKQKLTFQPQKGTPCKWLWTRMHCNKDGCEIYEIFKNSCICKQPPKCVGKPNIIFVVLPNGIIMPFETLNSHA